MSDAIALILARGGSKRIPRKNIRNFCGLPMIAWPIRVALASGLFSQVIVSTDDKEIAAVAKEHGAQCPELRPAFLSDDFSTTADVLHYLFKGLRAEGNLAKSCCCLYGTSAFLTADLLLKGNNLLQMQNTEVVMAVTEYPHPIERALLQNEEGFLHYFHADSASLRTQDCAVAYHDIGLLYWLDIQSFLASENNCLSNMSIRPLFVPRHLAIDIDTEDDWMIAESLFATLYKRAL